MRCYREHFIGVSNSEEEFKIKTSPKSTGESVYQGGAVGHCDMGNSGQDDTGSSSPGTRAGLRTGFPAGESGCGK